MLVVTNLLEQTQTNEGNFKNGIQKSLKQNTISAAFDIQKMADTYLKTEKNNTKDKKYLNKMIKCIIITQDILVD